MRFTAFLTYPPFRADTKTIDFENPDTLETVAIINQTGDEERDLERADHFYLEKQLEGTHFPFKNGKVGLREMVPSPTHEE